MARSETGSGVCLMGHNGREAVMSQTEVSAQEPKLSSVF